MDEWMDEWRNEWCSQDNYLVLDKDVSWNSRSMRPPIWIYIYLFSLIIFLFEKLNTEFWCSVQVYSSEVKCRMIAMLIIANY